MTARELGYYWVTWTDLADEELVACRPGPLIGRWDGKGWWFVRSDVYRFDSEVKVLSDVLVPPRQNCSRRCNRQAARSAVPADRA
jgi:hypothetical protein